MCLAANFWNEKIFQEHMLMGLQPLVSQNSQVQLLLESKKHSYVEISCAVEGVLQVSMSPYETAIAPHFTALCDLRKVTQCLLCGYSSQMGLKKYMTSLNKHI